ncbi:hypothetical protein [Actinomyces oris]
MSTDALVVHTVAVPNLRMGSASWDGKSLVAEVAVGEGGSIYRLGPLETLVLDALRRPGTPEQVQDRVEDGAGVRVPRETVNGLITAFALRGLVESTPRRIAPPPPGGLRAGPPRSAPWSGAARAAWAVARTPVLPVLGVVGLVLAGLTLVGTVTRWAEVSAAAGGLISLSFPRILLVVLGVVAWHMISQVGHELCHGLAFVGLGGGRRPVLSLTFLGPIPMPSTRLDGLGLLSARWRGLVVVAAGPLFTLAFAAIPVTAVVRSPAGNAVATWGAISLLIDLTIVILSLSPFPNTDMTRGLEILTGTRQLPIASARFRQAGRVPASLPSTTRLAVRAYPLLAIVAVSVALTWVTCLLRSLT